MNDLIVMALQCDVTRIITYMLDNSRSDLVYSWVQRRDYENGGAARRGHGDRLSRVSAPARHELGFRFDHPLAHRGRRGSPEEDGRHSRSRRAEPCSTIAWSSTAATCTMAITPPSICRSFCSAAGAASFVRTSWSCSRKPIEDIRQLRDLHFTVLNDYFKLNVKSFGEDRRGIPNQRLTQILA